MPGSLTVEILYRRDAPASSSAGVERELVSAGIAVHRMSFGLVCTGKVSDLSKILGHAVLGAEPGQSVPVPQRFASVIDAVTVPAAPTFF